MTSQRCLNVLKYIYKYVLVVYLKKILTWFRKELKGKKTKNANTKNKKLFNVQHA